MNRIGDLCVLEEFIAVIIGWRTFPKGGLPTTREEVFVVCPTARDMVDSFQMEFTSDYISNRVIAR